MAYNFFFVKGICRKELETIVNLWYNRVNENINKGAVFAPYAGGFG